METKSCCPRTGRRSENNGKCLQFILAFIVSALLVALSFPAWASEPKKEKQTEQIGSITVTATKMDTEVDKVPTNVAIISREEIERYPGNFSVFDVIRQANVPGIYMPFSAYGIDEDGLISTRGSEVSAMNMRVMVNGIEFNKGNGYVVPPRLAIHDVERIEIIKTPSAEYGDQAIGGVINIITRVAKKPLEAKVGVAYGGFGDGGNGYGVINGSNGRWEYMVDATMKRQDGYQNRTYTDDDNIYTRISYHLTDKSSLTFHGAYLHADANYANSLTLAQFNEDPQQNPGPDNTMTEKEKMAALVYDQLFGPHKMTVKLEFKDDLTEMFWYGWNRFDEWEVHPEANIAFNNKIGGMDNQLVLGVEYRYHTMWTNNNNAPNNVIGEPTLHTYREDTTWSGYIQDQLSITEALTITAGVRYDSYDQSQEGKINPSNTWTQENSAFSPKIGATYHVNDALNFFAGFNSGFKSPARVSAAATSGNLNPERIYSYEAGVRGAPFSWLNYNLALFWNEVEDKFVRPDPTPGSKYQNAGKTRSRGVEMGVNATFANGLYASGSLTIQEAKFVEFVEKGVSYNDNHLNGVPNMMFAAYLGYRHGVYGDISINPVYTGKRYFNYANTVSWDGFWVLNARYIKRFEDWNPQVELFVVANNIFDEQAVGCGGGNPGSESFYPYPGINVFVGVNVNF